MLKECGGRLSDDRGLVKVFEVYASKKPPVRFHDRLRCWGEKM
jgi:hypothetical protein